MRRGFKSNQEFAAALGNARSLGWIEVVEKGGSPVVAPKDSRKAEQYQSFLESLRGHETDEEKIPSEYKPYVEKLRTRGSSR